MTCDELARVWTRRWPRPDPHTNEHFACQVRKFGKDFRFRDVATISREEARIWARSNPGPTRYVRSMFYDALDDGLVTENVFAGLRVTRPQVEIVVPTTTQVFELAAVAPKPLDTMLIFSAYTGLRRGEARALALEDLQPTSRGRVKWQLTPDERLKKPKSKRSERIFLVPREAGLALDRRLAEREDVAGQTKRRAGRVWDISHDQWQSRWDKAREAAGIDVRWHSLRHHAATYFLNAGGTVDDVAKQLGCHPNEVRDRYGHPDHELALERLEGLVDDG